MPRIAGVDIPGQKQMWIALTYIHGIGRHVAMNILKEAQIGGLIQFHLCCLVSEGSWEKSYRRTDPRLAQASASLGAMWETSLII